MANKDAFLKLKGGWISPYAILWAETSKHNELMLIIGLEGKDKPIYLNETDSALLRNYLELNTWQEEEDLDEDEGE